MIGFKPKPVTVDGNTYVPKETMHSTCFGCVANPDEGGKAWLCPRFNCMDFTSRKFYIFVKEIK